MWITIFTTSKLYFIKRFVYLIFNLISGQLEKRRGFSVKLREFLLTEGPKLLYIDPDSKEIKGEIPWSCDLKAELKSFHSFSVHTPNRTYHLIDRSNNAIKWCKKIEEVKKLYFSNLTSNDKWYCTAIGIMVYVRRKTKEFCCWEPDATGFAMVRSIREEL